MNRGLKVLAIAVLALTVAAAGAVLYGLNAMTPVVEQITVTATPAIDAQDAFYAVMDEVQTGTFAGKQFADADGLSIHDCTFLTYTVRLKNRGFFPAEWISMRVRPAASDAGRDILQLGDTGAYVLGAQSRGDLRATILCAGDASDTQRALDVTCYVFGQRVVFEAE